MIKSALAALDDLGLLGGALVGSISPLQPNHSPSRCFERGIDRDGEAAGLARPLGIGNRDAVRDYDETRHQTSSHFTDSRVAELMMPGHRIGLREVAPQRPGLRMDVLG